MVHSQSQNSSQGLDGLMALLVDDQTTLTRQSKQEGKSRPSQAKKPKPTQEDGVAQLQEILVKPDIIDLRQKFTNLQEQVGEIDQDCRTHWEKMQLQLKTLQTNLVSQNQSSEQTLSRLENRLDYQKQDLVNLRHQVNSATEQMNGSLAEQLDDIRQELRENRQLSEKVILPAIAQLHQDLQTNRQLQEKLLDAVGGELQTVVTQIERKINALTPVMEERFNAQLEACQRVMMAKMTALTKEVVDLREKFDEPQETQFSIQVTGIES